jgi:hypothetical protein
MNEPDRRTFFKTVAAAAAAPLAAGTAAGQAEKPANLAATVDALTEAVRSRYGKYLDLDQLDQVRRGILRSQLASRTMAEVKLKNGDEPAFVFSAMDEQ